MIVEEIDPDHEINQDVFLRKKLRSEFWAQINKSKYKSI